MFHRIKFIVILLAAASATCGTVHAQHPIEVQRLSAANDHYQALVTFEKMPKRVATQDSVLAAAKSAWALSLPERAIEGFEEALRSPTLDDSARARIELSRGIIEHQEGRFQTAKLFGDKALQRLREAGPLRSRVYLLLAEGAMVLGSHGAAEELYLAALSEAGSAEQPEIHFLLGVCRMVLGKDVAAIKEFKLVPLGHERTPEAVRYLAQLSLKQGETSHAAFWLEEGRRSFPDQFLDSWVDYALMRVAADNGDVAAGREIREAAQKKYPPSDFWLTLLEAQAELLERHEIDHGGGANVGTR